MDHRLSECLPRGKSPKAASRPTCPGAEKRSVLESIIWHFLLLSIIISAAASAKFFVQILQAHCVFFWISLP